MTNRNPTLTWRSFSPAKKAAMLVVAGALLVACSADQDTDDRTRDSSSPAPTTGTVSVASDDEPYAFDRPLASVALPDELMEISGLAALSDGRLAAVQDEDGILFFLDAETGNVTARVPFGDAGDYEGIEQVGDRLFVLRSNGNLLELSSWREGEPDVRSHKTDLKSKNDTEGLTYDPANERLLVVTKEDPGSDLDEDRQRAIYAFDPEASELGSDPAVVIDLDEIRSVLKDVKSFRPSALAVHPQTGNVYVLSSNTQALVALDTDGSLRHAWKLDAQRFEQPEGLAFTPEGDLFISSEGVDGPAMLFRFAQQ